MTTSGPPGSNPGISAKAWYNFAMAVRIRYLRTELSEGIVETLHEVDKFTVQDDNSVELRSFNEETQKYKVVGYIHPDRWESIMLVEDSPMI